MTQLEKIAEEYGEEHQIEYWSEAYNLHTSKEDLIDAVIYGAQWQKKRGISLKTTPDTDWSEVYKFIRSNCDGAEVIQIRKEN